jgi:hypothetical protein
MAEAGSVVPGGHGRQSPSKGGFHQTGGSQRKYHARKVGIIQVDAMADREGETLVLLEDRHLSSGALAKARQAALKLDRRGYQVSDVYRQTPPAR